MNIKIISVQQKKMHVYIKEIHCLMTRSNAFGGQRSDVEFFNT